MQAARGAPLNTSGAAQGPSGSQETRQNRRRCLTLFAVIAVTAYLVDLVTKIVVVKELTGRAPVRVVGDLLMLTLARNPGAAFSTGTSYTVVLSFVALAAACVVLFFARRLGSTGWAVGLGFLLAGILGNLTDRLFREPGPLRGHVVDFLRLPHWPIFNVADMCINVAAAVVVVQALRGVSVSGRRAHDADHGAGPEDDDARDAAERPAEETP
jgi:signal peptidase II